MAKKKANATFNDILRELRNGNVRPLYVLEGQEDYLKSKLLKSIEKLVIEPSTKDLDYSFRDLDNNRGKISIQEIKNEINTPAFMSKKRLCAIKNSGLFSSGTGNTKNTDEQEISKNKPETDEMVDLLENIPEQSCLVFLEEKVEKRRKKVLEAISRKGLLADISKPDIRTVRTWVASELKKHGLVIEKEACDHFIERNDSRLQQMTEEIQKLVLYAKYFSITEIKIEDMDNIGIYDLKGGIFDLTDSLSKNNPQKAYKMLDSLISQRQPLPLISFMVGRHFRQLLIAKDIGNVQEIIRKMKVIPFVANKLYYQSNSFGENELHLINNKIFETEKSVKTSEIDDKTGIELLFAYIFSLKVDK